MGEWFTDVDALERICGDCATVDIMEFTPEHIRAMAALWGDHGEPCSEDMIEAAIKGLRYLQGQ